MADGDLVGGDGEALSSDFGRFVPTGQGLPTAGVITLLLNVALHAP